MMITTQIQILIPYLNRPSYMFGNLLVKLGEKMLGEPQKEYTRNPSVIIAQGILESGWETSEL